MANYFLLIDGLTDEKSAVLGNKTPLEYADCANMSKLRANSSFGLFATCPQGFVAESMTCIMTLLGVEPQFLPKGRAYLEAVAQQIPIVEDDLVLRCNLVAVDKGLVVASSALGLSPSQARDGAALVLPLASPSLQLFHMQDYKNLLVVRGGKSQGQALQTTPPHENLNQPIENFLPKGGELAEHLRELMLQSQVALKSHFANQSYQYLMVPWGQSYYQASPNFSKLFKAKGAVVCGTEIVKGIGRAMGLDVPEIAGATADTDTDLEAKAKEAIACGEVYDFVFVHVNGADEAGHRKNPLEKAKFVKQVDQKLLASIANNLKPGEKLLIGSDHGTNSQTGRHCGEPQPFILYEEGKIKNQNLGLLAGTKAVSLLLK